MKASVVVLSLSTVGFAASTVYLGARLHEVRSVDAEAAAVAALEMSASESVSLPAPPPISATPGPPTAEAPTIETRNTAVRPGPARRAGSRAQQIQREMAAAFMKRYGDPAQRAEMLAEQKASVRRLNRRLGEAVGLSSEEKEHLFGLISQHQLERTAAGHACALDELCDVGTYNFPDEQRQVAEVAGYLGADRYREYQQFRMSRTERQQVEQLRLKVADSTALRSSEAEKLIGALWEERERFFSDAKQRGVRLTSIDTNVGPVIMNANEQGRPAGLAPEMAEFQARMYERAAQVLSAEQLSAFKELQEQARRAARPARSGRSGGEGRGGRN